MVAASATPIVRAYGFYRSVGWQLTNTFDGNNDEYSSQNVFRT